MSREFIRLVAMQCASLDQLSPDRIGATDKLVRYLQHSLALTSEPRGGLFVPRSQSLSAPSAASRCPRTMPSTIRYFRPADAVVMLGELRQTVADGGSGRFCRASVCRRWAGRSAIFRASGGRCRPCASIAATRCAVRWRWPPGWVSSARRSPAKPRCGRRQPGAAGRQPQWFRGDLPGAFDPDVCRVGALVGAMWAKPGAGCWRWCAGSGPISKAARRWGCRPSPASLSGAARRRGRSWSGILCDPVVRGRAVRIVCEPGAMRSPRPVFAKVAGRTVKLQPGTVLVSGPGYQIVSCNVA